LKTRYKAKISQLAIDGFVTWQYTQSTITETSSQRRHTIGTQLIYTPFHTGSAVLKLLLHSFSITPSAQFSGRRFTDTSNDALYALPHFFLYNTAFGYQTLVKQHRFNFSFSVKNLTNINYQLYAARAMPGRNYSFQINYQLNLTRNTK
jgi:vitamin B12 transporter